LQLLKLVSVIGPPSSYLIFAVEVRVAVGVGVGVAVGVGVGVGRAETVKFAVAILEARVSSVSWILF